MENKHKERLEDTIKALGKSHKQMLEILEKKFDIDDIDEEKWKIVADGKGKALEVANKIMIDIAEKEKELEVLNKHKDEKQEQKIKEGSANLNKYLK